MNRKQAMKYRLSILKDQIEQALDLEMFSLVGELAREADELQSKIATHK